MFVKTKTVNLFTLISKTLSAMALLFIKQIFISLVSGATISSTAIREMCYHTENIQFCHHAGQTIKQGFCSPAAILHLICCWC